MRKGQILIFITI